MLRLEDFEVMVIWPGRCTWMHPWGGRLYLLICLARTSTVTSSKLCLPASLRSVESTERYPWASECIDLRCLCSRRQCNS
jgi:hypothetical protein